MIFHAPLISAGEACACNPEKKTEIVGLESYFQISLHLLYDNDGDVSESTWGWQTAPHPLKNISPFLSDSPTETLCTNSTRFEGTWMSREPWSQRTASSRFSTGQRTRQVSSALRFRSFMPDQMDAWRFRASVRSPRKSAKVKCTRISNRTASKVSVDIHFHFLPK